MFVQFYLKYATRYGQRIFLLTNNLPGKNGEKQKLLMSYVDEDHWELKLDLDDSSDPHLFYYYMVENEDGFETYDGEEDRHVDLSHKNGGQTHTVIDTWNDAGDVHNAFFTKPFKNVLLPQVQRKKTALPDKWTHEFRIKAPLLKAHEIICISGSTPHLKNWDATQPLLMTPKGNWFVCRVQMEENEWPASYKYGIYDLKEKKLVSFEDGPNRMLRNWEVNAGKVILHDGFVHKETELWRGAGVNIPVFSIRTHKNFGTGQFSDLKLLIDWAKKTGLQMIQLLPINDTSAQGNWKDSYPYSSVSAFALHPLYIDLEKVADKKNLKIVTALRKKQKQLNQLPVVDYEQVMKFKMSALRELYDLQKDNFKDDVQYFEFFEMNRHWLVPYAAYSYLKEKYKTADYTQWKLHSVYDESAIQKFVAPSTRHYHKIAFYYFVQYHLHLQLKEISRYAHKNNVVLKGDIPIGIYRYSCDAWVEPHLYNLDEQAGAPPDEFASKGQNWGFPTYNWDRMKEDNFKWWRRRFDQMANYFDAFRIDHILGFFRIWSIPYEAIEGIMGRFVPALPVHLSEFYDNDIWFDHHRYCKPFITDPILKEIFGEKADEIKETFIDTNADGSLQLKEVVNTQRKAKKHLEGLGKQDLQDGINALLSNVILFVREGSGAQEFDFRIGMEHTLSFRHLDEHTRNQLKWLYVNYFYERQDYFWKKGSMHKLPPLKRSTNMLVCGEDLGMVPPSVPDIMRQLGILGLEVERMPKTDRTEFFNPSTATYLSVVMPSTHDMSTLREWWHEDKEKIQIFYNQVLGHYGEAPDDCEAWISKEIIQQHLNSPAMWSIFLIQDLFGMSEKLKMEDPRKERINVPSDPNHYWRYRMQVPVEELLKEDSFNKQLKEMVTASNRATN